MPTKDGMPTLDEATPYPEAPLYFVRLWDPAPSQDQEPASVYGLKMDAVVVPGPLEIYGYSCRSPYREDWPREDERWRAGFFPAICFSQVEPDGEYGFVPVLAVTELSRERLVQELAALMA